MNVSKIKEHIEMIRKQLAVNPSYFDSKIDKDTLLILQSHIQDRLTEIEGELTNDR